VGDRGSRGRRAVVIGRICSGLATLLKERSHEGIVGAEDVPIGLDGSVRALAPRMIFLPTEEAGADPTARRGSHVTGRTVRESSRIGVRGTWIVVGRWTVGLRRKLVSREVHRDGSFGVGGEGGGLSQRGKVGCRGLCLFGCVGESRLDRSEFVVQNSGDAVVDGATTLQDVAFGFDGVVAKVVEGVQLLILSTN